LDGNEKDIIVIHFLFEILFRVVTAAARSDTRQSKMASIKYDDVAMLLLLLQVDDVVVNCHKVDCRGSSVKHTESAPNAPARHNWRM
jgi:hypothetical protein